MPPRNTPVPNAKRLFNCAICDKGYPRQLDYENHLRSYDHNHRQRLADMKKLTASNSADSAKPKQGVELQRVEIATGKTGSGTRFTKIGPAGGLGRGFTKIGGGFRRVGTVVGREEGKEVVGEAEKVEGAPVQAVVETQPESGKDGDAVVAEDLDDFVTWEEYDFTRPTGCDHATCGGCRTDGIWGRGWVAV
ncbi:hypothetical protein EJ07DRAFT_171491 [Lizonia empirigonia]|nr:hypothetical protein EJ07DRAFT_171491 [Lizonia empirigonia]